MNECIPRMFSSVGCHNFVDVYDEEDISLPKEVVELAKNYWSSPEGAGIVLEAGTLHKSTWVKTYCTRCGQEIKRDERKE